jgi:excinuclease ABC subunit A
LGPEGGSGGGELVATGTPEAVARVPTSHTGRYLAPLLRPSGAAPTAAKSGARAVRAKKR